MPGNSNEIRKGTITATILIEKYIGDVTDLYENVHHCLTIVMLSQPGKDFLPPAPGNDHGPSWLWQKLTMCWPKPGQGLFLECM